MIFGILYTVIGLAWWVGSVRWLYRDDDLPITGLDIGLGLFSGVTWPMSIPILIVLDWDYKPLPDFIQRIFGRK